MLRIGQILLQDVIEGKEDEARHPPPYRGAVQLADRLDPPAAKGDDLVRGVQLLAADCPLFTTVQNSSIDQKRSKRLSPAPSGARQDGVRDGRTEDAVTSDDTDGRDRGLSQYALIVELNAEVRPLRLCLHSDQGVEQIVVGLHRGEEGRLEGYGGGDRFEFPEPVGRVGVLVRYHVEAGLSGAVAWRDGEVASARGPRLDATVASWDWSREGWRRTEPVTNEDAVAALRGRNGLQDDRLELFLGRHVGDACLLR